MANFKRIAAFFGAALLTLIPTANYAQSVSQALPIPVPQSMGGTGKTSLNASLTTPTGTTTAQALATKLAQNISVTDFGAVCDGTTDDGPALRAALSAASVAGGGIVNLCKTSSRIVATAANSGWTIPANTTVQGYGASSVLRFDSDVPGSAGVPGPYRQLFSNGGNNIAMKNFSVLRIAPYMQTVLFALNAYSGILMSNVSIDCVMNTASASYCHGFQVGAIGTTQNLVVEKSNFTYMSYGLFMTNAATGTVKNITFEDNVFSNNYSDDLEFNGPLGAISNVMVRNNVFKDNQQTLAGSGFAVGFASVNGATVTGGSMTNYNNECIHIEDYTTDILIDDVLMTSCGVIRASFIQVISGSSRIKIRSNKFDASSNISDITIVNSLAGGSGCCTPSGRAIIAPTYVSVLDNNFIQGAYADGVYLEANINSRVIGNTFRGLGSVTAGVYSGSLNSGVYVYSGQSAVISNNDFSRMLWAIRPLINTVDAYGNASIISNNIFSDVFLALPVLDARSVAVTGNNFFNTVNSLIYGPSTSSSYYSTYPVNITGNNSYQGTYAMVINGTTTVRRTGSTVNIGVGVVVPVIAVDFYMPIGTVLTFTGGGVLTLTVAANSQDTSLTGTITIANIAGTGTATYTIPAAPATTVVANNRG